MMTYDDYERKIQLLAKQWRECKNEESKKILFIRGKLLRLAQDKCKERPVYPEQKSIDKDKPLEPKEQYDVAKMIFG